MGCAPWLTSGGYSHFFFVMFADNWLWWIQIFTPALEKPWLSWRHILPSILPFSHCHLPQAFPFLWNLPVHPTDALKLKHFPSHQTSTLTSTPACHFPSISHQVTPAQLHQGSWMLPYAIVFKPHLPEPGPESVPVAAFTLSGPLFFTFPFLFWPT